MKLNAKQRNTLQQVFEKPTPHLRIDWQDIKSLLVACDAKILEGEGSEVRIVLGKRRAFLHRPHSQKEAKAYQVKAIRDLRESEGIKP